ncbi:hypothetical protein D3C72_1311260 [compost metagenome]
MRVGSGDGTRGIQGRQHVDAAETAQAGLRGDHTHRLAVDPGPVAAQVYAQRVQVRTVDDHRTGFAQLCTQLRRQDAREHHRVVRRGDAGQIHRHVACALRAGAPLAVDPFVGLDAGDIRVHAQPAFDVRADRMAVVHALRTGKASPDIGGRCLHVDCSGTEDAQHQRCLHDQQDTGETHGQHHRQEPAPLVNQRLTGKRDHCASPSGSTGKGAPPTARYSDAKASTRAPCAPIRSACADNTARWLSSPSNSLERPSCTCRACRATCCRAVSSATCSDWMLLS